MGSYDNVPHLHRWMMPQAQILFLLLKFEHALQATINIDELVAHTEGFEEAYINWDWNGCCTPQEEG